MAILSNLLTSIVWINLGNLRNLIILQYFKDESEEDINNSKGIIDNKSIKKSKSKKMWKN